MKNLSPLTLILLGLASTGCSSDFVYQLEPDGKKYCVPSKIVQEDPLFGYGGRQRQKKPGDFLISNCLRYDPKESAEHEGCWISNRRILNALISPAQNADDYRFTSEIIEGQTRPIFYEGYEKEMTFDASTNTFTVSLKELENPSEGIPREYRPGRNDRHYVFLNQNQETQPARNPDDLRGRYQDFIGLAECTKLTYPRDDYFYACDKHLDRTDYFVDYTFYTTEIPGKAELDKLDEEIIAGIEKLECE